jgi:amidase
MAADGDFPGHPDDSITTADAAQYSAGCAWEKVSARKVADRAAILARWPQWRMEQEVPNSVLDVSRLPTARLTQREREIVHEDATALVEALRERRYTALEVTKAFCHVAAIAQCLTNCLTEVFFAEALDRAAELDRHISETGNVVGPLHGLPVSIKDHILVKDHDTASGYVGWAYRTQATKDAVAVDILRKAGAVLYVKTANPQTLLVRHCLSVLSDHRIDVVDSP